MYFEIPPSKKPISLAPINPPMTPIKSQGKRAFEMVNTESDSSMSAETPAIAWISSSASSWTTSKISSTVIRPTNLFLAFTTGTDSKSYFRIKDATSSWSISTGTEITSSSIMLSMVVSEAERIILLSDTRPSSCCLLLTT